MKELYSKNQVHNIKITKCNIDHKPGIKRLFLEFTVKNKCRKKYSQE